VRHSKEQAYCMREVDVADPDGNVIFFGVELNRN
jgi:hypothetical protein